MPSHVRSFSFYNVKIDKMLLIHCRRLTSSYGIRKISTNVSKNLMKEHYNPEQKRKFRSTALYMTGLGILVAGLSYAAVPLYRIFCQAYSYGGTVVGHDDSKVESMKPIKERKIKVQFSADVGASMAWNFKPLQRISTYNVLPFEVGQYFNKIQCFCFEEQLLNPHEQVDMPVFFYIDPEFNEDPKMEFINDIALSYTFFESKEDLKLPLPSYIKKHVTSK
ncbi:hypothetical protein HZH66_011176 [Vespula vulgaris]|uniref:Cytochrome c oxidase assembly protein COX11 n=1 Tax=Vespula vulgaris TaxID=7454 RepID=A0A834JE48_VESVU|nr:hypothetical protein HZH66_011176 [Vespula vulgaris]